MRSSRASAGETLAVSQAPSDPALSQALEPRSVEQLLRVKGDMRLGLPVILKDGAGTVLAASIESLTRPRYTAMTALGASELVLTRRRALALGAQPAPLADTLRLRVPAGADLSVLAELAGQGAATAAGAPPGLLPILKDGTTAQRAAVALAKSVQMLPAVLTVPLAADTAEPAGLTAMSAHAVLDALGKPGTQQPVSSASLPMDASEAGRVHVYRPDDGGTEHYAIEIGAPDRAGPILVRLHSACFTGDVLGSLKCDCGQQLRVAIAAMAEAGGGVLLYLNQEGRGIGLANKMRAYALQDAGMDTVEANHWLGFEDDQRDFRIGAQILRRMGIGRVRLLTNNPAKTAILSEQAIDVVDRVPLNVGQTRQNAHYLATKAAKSGHLL